MAACPNCGRQVEAGASFCANCGQDMRVSVPQDQRIQTENVNVPTPPPQSTGRRFSFGRILLLGCGGLLALLVLVVIIAVAMSGGNDSSTSSSSSSDTPASSSSSETPASKSKEGEKGNTTAAIGETVKSGDSSWVVTSATPATQLNDPNGFQPPKQGDFVLVDFTFTNNGTEAKTLSSNIISLFDSSNRKSSPDTDDFGYIPQDKNIFLNQVNPGVSKDGEVVFTVAPGASGFKLELADTNLFSTSSKAYVDLGF